MREIQGKLKMFLHRSEGFTLIEILVAFSLLSLVITCLYTFYFFSINSFTRGVAYSDLQQNIRVGSDFVKRELMFAENIELVQEDRVKYRQVGDSNSYELRQKGREIVLLINSVEQKVAYNIEELEFDLDDNVLYFYIKGKDGNKTYNYNSTVELKNM